MIEKPLLRVYVLVGWRLAIVHLGMVASVDLHDQQSRISRDTPK